MMTGRLLWGMAFGAFSVVSAKMVSEIVPVELGGSFGAINQMSLTFGAAIPGTFALLYPRHSYDYDDFDKNQYYRIIWSSALVVSAL